MAAAPSAGRGLDALRGGEERPSGRGEGGGTVELGPPQPPLPLLPPPPGNDLGGSGRPQLAAASHFCGYREELRLPVSSRPPLRPPGGARGSRG